MVLRMAALLSAIGGESRRARFFFMCGLVLDMPQGAWRRSLCVGMKIGV